MRKSKSFVFTSGILSMITVFTYFSFLLLSIVSMNTLPCIHVKRGKCGYRQKPHFSSGDLLLNHRLRWNWHFQSGNHLLDIPHRHVLFTKDERDHPQLMRFIWTLHSACVNLAARAHRDLHWGRATKSAARWALDPQTKWSGESLYWDSELSSLWPDSKRGGGRSIPSLQDAGRDECVKRDWLC